MWPFSGAKVENDPICGMEVEVDDSLLQFYNRETYHFCSSSCRASFQSDPGKYAKSSEAAVEESEESKEEEAATPASS